MSIKNEKKDTQKSSVKLLDASGLAIKHIEVSDHEPKSPEIRTLLEQKKTSDPLENLGQMSPAKILYEYEKAFLGMRVYAGTLTFTDKEAVNKVLESAEFKNYSKIIHEEFFIKFPPDNKEVKIKLTLSAIDYMVKLRAFDNFAQLYGMVKFDVAKNFQFQLRLNELVIQLKNEGLLKLKGFLRLLDGIFHNKSNEELRAIFRRHKIPEPSIKKFFREHPERKQRHGQPNEFAIYQEADGSYYYNTIDFNCGNNIIERSIFNADEAFERVKQMNKG